MDKSSTLCKVHVNKRQRIQKKQSKKDNQEKLATQGTEDEEKQRNWQHRVQKTKKNRETGNIGYRRRRKLKQKHNTICVGQHYPQTNTNNVNKTCALL